MEYGIIENKTQKIDIKNSHKRKLCGLCHNEDCVTAEETAIKNKFTKFRDDVMNPFLKKLNEESVFFRIDVATHVECTDIDYIGKKEFLTATLRAIAQTPLDTLSAVVEQLLQEPRANSSERAKIIREAYSKMTTIEFRDWLVHYLKQEAEKDIFGGETKQ